MIIEELYRVYLEHPSVQTDTRRLQPGDLFFALTGPNFNGNAFAQKAIDAGAAFAVIDDPAYAVEGKTFVVRDTLQALQDLALHHRKQFSVPFLAITGSNGKTTTKELVHAVLASTFKTYTTEGNLNNHIGVPLTILKIRKDAEMAVIEMGANHLGEIASYCKVALPTHGLITNCGKAHLEGFGGEEGVRKGKGELFDHLSKNNGMAFIMQDYAYLQDMSKDIGEIFTYGTVDAGITGNVSASEPFLEVNFSKGFHGSVATKLVGSYNLPNVLAAVACGKYFGVPDEKIRQSIAEYTPSNSRSQLVVKGSNKIILDAYNANPSSMKLAIENFGRIEEDSKIVMLGAMAELGPQSIKEHEEIIDLLQQYRWKHVVLVGGDFSKIKHPFIQLNNATEAAAWLQQQNPAHSSLLVKGSRSMQMEKVLEQL